MDEHVTTSSMGSADPTGAAGAERATASPTSKARMIAVAVTAVALLAIAIPFVWDGSESEVGLEATAATTNPAGDPAPAASHDADPAACMANPKPANFDFTMK